MPMPLRPSSAMAPEPSAGGCGGGESFALMVVGESMAPEFRNGEIIIIEPEGLAIDGSYVLACLDGEWTFRQLVRAAPGWRLRAVNPAFPELPIADLAPIKGVITQAAQPGRRRATRRYV